MPTGTIKGLVTDRGYGFIQTAEERDLFFHRSELQGVDYATLREGQQVEFELGQGRDGRPQATRVRLAQPEAEEHQAETDRLGEGETEPTTQDEPPTA